MRDIDLRLEKAAGSFYDISFASNGDFDMVQGFDTSLQFSILGEKRAAPSEMPNALRRRGWIGNVLSDTPDFEVGSKIWLFEQAKLVNNTINGIKDAALDALNWLLEESIATNVDASVIGISKTGSVTLRIIIEFSSGQVEERYFELWEKTGK